MALDFPASSASPYTAPNGVVYTWNTDGYWEAKADPNDFDTDYLKLNATNGPVTGNLALDLDLSVGDNLSVGDGLTVTGTSAFTGLTTHESGVKVTGGRLEGPSNFQIRTPGGAATGNTFSINEENTGGPAFILNAKAIASGSSNAICLSLNYNSATDQTQAASCLFTQFGEVATSTQNVYHNFAAVSSQQNTSGDYIAYYTRINSGDNLGSGNAYSFFSGGDAPNYFKGDITCDGLINGAFSLRMQSDDPAAFTTTITTDEEGNEVSNSVYQGTTEDLLSIIKDLRARVTALEAAAT